MKRSSRAIGWTLALVWALGFWGAAFAAPPRPAGCDGAARRLTHGLSMASVAMDWVGALELTFDHAVRTLARCGDDEGVWYVAVRAVELGAHRFPVRIAGREVADLHGLVSLALEREPKSARIATVAARQAGSVEAARHAVMLDPDYGPAEVALGAALFYGGQVKAARGVLEKVNALERVRGGCTLLAEVRLADGDPQGALEAAHRERSEVSPLEPDLGGSRVMRQKLEVEARAELAAGRTREGTRLLLSLAVQGSPSARALLRSAPPSVRRALADLARDRQLSAKERSLARKILSGLGRRAPR